MSTSSTIPFPNTSTTTNTTSIPTTTNSGTSAIPHHSVVHATNYVTPTGLDVTETAVSRTLIEELHQRDGIENQINSKVSLKVFLFLSVFAVLTVSCYLLLFGFCLSSGIIYARFYCLICWFLFCIYSILSFLVSHAILWLLCSVTQFSKISNKRRFWIYFAISFVCFPYCGVFLTSFCYGVRQIYYINKISFIHCS